MAVAEQAHKVTNTDKASAVPPPAPRKPDSPVMSAVPESAAPELAPDPGKYETIGDVTATDPVLTVRDCNVYYGDNHALQHVNLDVGRNQVVALIGPSGCGKSTFIRCLNRMNDTIDTARVTGELKLHGEDINSRETDVVLLRARVGMVFQKPNPFPKSIYENVAYGPRINGWKLSKRQMDELVERSLRGAALWEEVKDKINQNGLSLSGGQQQRLCIARALAVEPEVILMDEPCSALDPISTLKIEELMLELRRNYTIIIVTHNMQQASRVSDYTAFFLMDSDRAGQLVEYGPTEQIFTSPHDKRTEDYISGRFG